jgi:D-galactarolactone cycloisomerase
LSIEDDARRIKAIREAVGPNVQIGVDANHAYSVPIAARMARLLEPLNIAFFEEPVVPEDLDGHAKLRLQTKIPIASGENWFTRYQFLEAF